MTARRWLGLLAVVLMTGCATMVPEELAGRVNRSVTGVALISDPDRYRGEVVVVGGEILAVQNHSGESELEVLERPLSREEPLLTDQSAGRFLIHATEFLDPAVYAVGRRVTVVGVVAGTVERKIDDRVYRYPVVESRRLKLWPRQTAYPPYPPPYWYDPFWGPGWYGPYPYWWWW